jgi:uncharacterized protein (DUF3820 family)
MDLVVANFGQSTFEMAFLKMPFGKFKGIWLLDIPLNYLRTYCNSDGDHFFNACVSDVLKRSLLVDALIHWMTLHETNFVPSGLTLFLLVDDIDRRNPFFFKKRFTSDESVETNECPEIVYPYSYFDGKQVLRDRANTDEIHSLEQQFGNSLNEMEDKELHLLCSETEWQFVLRYGRHAPTIRPQLLQLMAKRGKKRK